MDQGRWTVRWWSALRMEEGALRMEEGWWTVERWSTLSMQQRMWMVRRQSTPRRWKTVRGMVARRASGQGGGLRVR
jgi:hypothetical protein